MSEHLSTEQRAGITVVRLDHAQLVDSKLIRATGADLSAAVKNTTNDVVVIDLSQVQTLFSQAIGMLVQAHRVAEPLGKRLLLAGVGEVPREALSVARLDRLFSFYPDLDSALAAGRPS